MGVRPITVLQHYLVVFSGQADQRVLWLVVPIWLTNLTAQTVGDRIDGFINSHPSLQATLPAQLAYYVTGINDIDHPFYYGWRKRDKS